MPSTDYFQRPLIPLALAGFLGVLSANYFAFVSPFLVLVCACGLAGVALWLRASRAALPLLVMGSFLAYAGLAGWAASPRPDDIGFWIPRRDILAIGRLEGFPEPLPKYSQWTGILACEMAIWQGRCCPVSGKVQFILSEPMPTWNPGDRILVRGTLAAIDPPLNPAEFDYEEFMAVQGVRASMQGNERSDAVLLQAGAPLSWGRWAGRLRRRLNQGINETVFPEAAALTRSVVLGDRSGLSGRLQESMSAAGLAHILAVSGLNVSLVFLFAAGLARLCGLPRKLGLVLGMAGVAWFALAAGGSPPVARAAVMAIGTGFGFLGGRRVDPLSGLSLAALILMAADPLSGRTASFQLTFVATAAILMTLPGPVKAQTWLGRAGTWCWQGLRLTGAALLGTAPLSIYYFYSLAPAALITNLLAGPCVTLTTIAGLCAGLLGKGALYGGWLTGRLAGWGAHTLILIAHWAEAWPWGRVFLWPGNGWWILCCYAMLAGACREKRRWLFITGMCGLALLYPALKSGSANPASAKLMFMALNKGEATWVQVLGRINVLIDTGTETDFLRRVKPWLAAQGINRLDALVLSHWDEDHAGGAPACLDIFRPGLLIHCGWPSLEAAAGWKNHCLAGRTALWQGRQGDCINLARGVSLEILWPPAGVEGQSNQNCLVTCLKLPDRRWLFFGDNPAGVERQVQLPGACALLKAGHHGSRTASSSDLLLHASPQLAVIMPGTRNPYGFPDPETCRRLGNFCGSVLDTKSRGAVEVRTENGGAMSFNTWK